MTTTPTKNESLPELPEYAASLHVQHFRNAPSMRNTDFVESFDFPEGAHRLYTADQMRAYAEAALTREAPTEGVPDGDQQTIDALVDRIDWWADKYETEGGHGVIVQLLRQYAGMVSKLTATPPAPQRLAQGEDFDNLCVAVQICRDLSWNAVTSEKPVSLTDKIARLVAYVERRKS